jgi:hypothetical protein
MGATFGHRLMPLSGADLTRASGSLRAYSVAGHDKDRDEAHSILTDLILDAKAQGDQEAIGALNEARLLLSMGHSQANDADNMLDALARTRRE